jgi:YggT family protein
MAGLISLVFDILTWAIILHVLFSYFLSPYHPLREALDRFVEPMLAPIRRYVAPVGGLDLSPVVLILILQVLGMVLARMFARF